ncbi:MAG TPA: hypothetical protein VGG63_09860 [Steroidobacteraceae bacterium]|jgi:hypothetical protein
MHKNRTKSADCASIVALLLALGLGPLAPRAPAAESPPAASAVRDGQHDFDFLFGRWKVHLKRKAPGTDHWTESDGYGVYRKVWGGRANLNEFFSVSPSDHVEGLTLRTYNPATHLWSLYWASSRDGILSSAQVGRFDHGRGEFYSQDNSDGTGTLVRYVWSNSTPTSAHFEQAFSQDGGRSWQVNWISDMTRIGDAGEATSSGVGTADEPPGQRDFEPLLGRWNFHLKVRSRPLTGSNQWIDYTGPGECIPLWHGRAQLDTINLKGPTKHIEGLTVRLFSPRTHEWHLYWANSRDGRVVVPQIGQFKAGHGEFYAQDTFEDKTILIKFDWSAMQSKAPHFEQSFSNDGGKSWEVNWISDQTRAN